MRSDRYLYFSPAANASSFLDLLHKAMQHQDIWAEPNTHPFEDKALVPWNDDYLAKYNYLIESVEQISPEQARSEGFIFGRIKGPFAHARAKLEEAQLLQEALTSTTPLPNFSVYRALFFGFLSSTYALKEALRKSCKRLGSKAESWFEEQFQRLKANSLVWAFYQMNNDNKHGPDDLPLRSYLRQLEPLQITGGPTGKVRVVMSNEGIFGVQNEGTDRERVVNLVGSMNGIWEVMIEMPEHNIVGSATQLSKEVLRFYEILVFDARKIFGNEYPNAATLAPTI